MKFDSSILLENSSKDIEVASKEFVESTEPCDYLSTLLEFNDTMHRLDVEEKINYYRLLTESSLGNCTQMVLYEGIGQSIKDFVQKTIQAIKDFIAKIFGVFKKKNAEDAAKNFEDARRYASAKKPNSNGGRFIFYNHTHIMDPAFDNFNLAPAFTHIADNIIHLCQGKDVDTDGEKKLLYVSLQRMVKNVAKTGMNPKDIKDASSLKEFINEAMFTQEVKECSITEFQRFYDTQARFLPCNEKMAKEFTAMLQKHLSWAKRDLDRCQTAAKNAKDIDDSFRSKINTLISLLKEVVDIWVWYINKASDLDIKMIRHYVKIVNQFFGSNHAAPDIKMSNESAMMHGEEFDGDTIFANNDMRDFNPTEWLDLELKTEAYAASYEVLECRRRIAAEEARIICEHNGIGCEKELIAMREAEAGKLAGKFNDIIKYIKQAIQQFIAQFGEQINLANKYIKANQETINKPFKFTGTISSNGDIINGMKRVKEQITPKPFNYESLKGDLSDDKEFFSKYIKPSLTGNCRAIWPSNMTVAEWCKCYFGASMPKDRYKPVEYTANQLPKEEIVAFLQSNGIVAGIKKELAAIEAEANKAAHFAAASQPVVGATSSAEQAPKAEGYYSELYGKYLHEVDTGDANTDASKPNGGAAAGDNVQNDQKAEEKKAAGERDKAFRNYLQAYRNVLTAKMTAAAFIRTELFQIIKFHVDSYKKGQQAAAKQQQAQAAPAQGQQPPQQ